ncbi:hypothetical protein RirG_081960 [Rhizophagus irregularis DAOM 197198w]|uniref:Protein kinase domain-containing protein n=1 Tax=Rhizophagus irregularis (strain DAOM 197198w) TaxID=1432141 RepID=A0A015MWA9_RHIIW|nr:hypothetical protein RirG_081960 [Rhizophagus irregularis DAOM 197198w]
MELIEKKYGEYTIKSITKYDNSFDPTPKLKSSPIPIKFISFNENDDNCFYCKNPYTETLLFKQKYCETCLFQYINYVDNDHKYLDPNITVSLNSVSLYRYYLNDPVSSLKWISYSNIKIIKEIAQGGFGIIYQATLLEYEDAKITVAVKKFLSSKST